MHPHGMQHPPRGPPTAQAAGPIPPPWGDSWSVPEAPDGSPSGGGGGGGGSGGGSSGAAVHQRQREMNLQQQNQHRQRRQQHQEQHVLQGQRHQRQEASSAGVVPPGGRGVGVVPSSPALSASSPLHAPKATPPTKPLSMSSSSPLQDSPGSATDMSSALANGELSAAARVFIPTNLSPAKPLTSSASGGTPGARRPGGGGGGVAPTTNANTSSTSSAAAAGLTPPRPPAVPGSGALRSSPVKAIGGGGGVGLPLTADTGLFGPSWGSMAAGMGASNSGNNAGSGVAVESGKKTGDASSGVNGRDVPDSSSAGGSLWGGVGLGVGGAVPSSAQAIWGGASLLETALTGGGSSSGAGADALSLLLPPAGGVEDSGVSGSGAGTGTGGGTGLDAFGLSSPWGVSAMPRDGTGGVGDDFAGALGASLGGLQLDDTDNVSVVGGGGKGRQHGDVFGAATGSHAEGRGGLSWG